MLWYFEWPDLVIFVSVNLFFLYSFVLLFLVTCILFCVILGVLSMSLVLFFRGFWGDRAPDEHEDEPVFETCRALLVCLEQADRLWGPHVGIEYLGCGRLCTRVRPEFPVIVTRERLDLRVRLIRLFSESTAEYLYVNRKSGKFIFRDAYFYISDRHIQDHFGHLNPSGCENLCRSLSEILRERR